MSYLGAYNYGFSHPWIAKYAYNESAGTASYSDGFRCGEGASTSVKPNYANAKLAGDNRTVEEVTEFTTADVALEVTKMPLAAKNVCFGHAISQVNQTEASNIADQANYCGYGFTTKNSDGTYDACVLYKVKFTEQQESYKTKGDSIEFNKPTLNGSATGRDTDGAWRDKQYGFATEALAEEWVKIKLGIVAQVAAPVASPAGGTYDVTQTVTLTSATDGATIYYTTNGTTPSATNGSTYSSAITVSTDEAIKAIAVKSGSTSSDVVTNEYFVS